MKNGWKSSTRTTSKYRNKRIYVNGEKFDSMKEYRRYQDLRLMECMGEISHLKRQIPFTLFRKSKYGREIKYIADFTYLQNGKYVVEDVKSLATKTPLYRLKKRILAEHTGIIIKEVE